jgi:alpha-L-fucosidase
MFVNSEAIYSVRPWIVPYEAAAGEDRIWFTQGKNDGPLYAIVDSENVWERGTWREFTLHSVKATAETAISVLGQDDRTLEYKPQIVPKSTFTQEADGLHVRVMRAQRLQDNSRWPNALVVKLTHVAPAARPLHLTTGTSVVSSDHSTITLNGDLLDLGDARSVEAGFEYRSIAGEDVHARSTQWIATPTHAVTAKGPFSFELRDLPPGTYEFHAIVKYPWLTFYGADKVIR